MCPTRSSSPHDTGRTSNLRTAFDVLDSDGDGKISYHDLRTFFHAGDEEDGMIRSMMAVADSNKDGYVEYEEFEKVLLNENNGNGDNNKKKGGRGWRVKVMEDAFRVMDKDGDGRLGHQDLKTYLGWAGVEADDDDVRAMISLAEHDEHQHGGEGVTLEALLRILAV